MGFRIACRCDGRHALKREKMDKNKVVRTLKKIRELSKTDVQDMVDGVLEEIDSICTGTYIVCKTCAHFSDCCVDRHVVKQTGKCDFYAMVNR